MLTMFTYVNEIAVIGTSLFMVAVAMVWYSEYLFLKPWMKAVGFTKEDIEGSLTTMRRNFILTYVAYVTVVFIIAFLIGYAQVLNVPVRYVALALSVGFAALLAGFVIGEQRSVTYFYITAGFSTVFIVGSTVLLYYWPW